VQRPAEVIFVLVPLGPKLLLRLSVGSKPGSINQIVQSTGP
jgi:hypothetical protein